MKIKQSDDLRRGALRLTRCLDFESVGEGSLLAAKLVPDPARQRLIVLRCWQAPASEDEAGDSLSPATGGFTGC